MSVEPAPRLSVSYLAEQCGFCTDCPLARRFALDIVESAETGKPIDPELVAVRFAGYISLCSREQPFPSEDNGEGPCMSVNEQRRCLHDGFRNLHGEEKADLLNEILGTRVSE